MIVETGFSIVNEFNVLVMRTITSGSDIKGEDKLTAEEVRSIRERLKKLGYLKEGEEEERLQQGRGGRG